jgi:CRP-like cAMP-binding protein/small-conductance mechanosensitive channel
MPTYDTLHDASLFAAIGLLFAIITMRRARALRKGMVTMVVLMAMGLAIVALLVRYGGDMDSRTLVMILREIALLIVTFALVRIGVIFLFEVLLARAAVPRMMADVLMAVTLIIYAIYRMNEIGVNLASLITTSAVLTGGIALQADNTCRLGDWIRVDGVVGQIIGIRWRCLAVATNDGETVMMPNAQLVNSRVTVLARRGDFKIPWRRPVEFFVSYNVPPSRVISVIEAAFARSEIPNVATEPRLVCTCRGFDDNSIRYAVLYWLSDLALDQVTDSEVRAHVFATLTRNHMDIPLPHRVILTPDAVNAQQEATISREMASRLEVLGRLNLFAELTDGERRALAAELKDEPYVQGDVISREGEVSDSLYILASGSVEIVRQGMDATGERQHLADQAAPNHFGEMGLLTGQARSGTVIARDQVLCYRLEKRGFDAILKARPEIAEAMSQVVAARLAANDATLQALDDVARRKRASGSAGELLRKIRVFFDLAQ